MPPDSSVCLHSDIEHPTNYSIYYEVPAHHIMYQNNMWYRLVTACDLFWCRDRLAGIDSCTTAHHQSLSPTRYVMHLGSDAALSIHETQVLEWTDLKQKGCCKASLALQRIVFVNLVFQTGKNKFKKEGISSMVTWNSFCWSRGWEQEKQMPVCDCIIQHHKNCQLTETFQWLLSNFPTFSWISNIFISENLSITCA